MFQVTKTNEKENKKKNDKAFRAKRESLCLTAHYNGWGFREVFGDKRGFGEGWGLREYLQLWWGFGELSRYRVIIISCLRWYRYSYKYPLLLVPP
jgi:hypothetical protein